MVVESMPKENLLVDESEGSLHDCILSDSVTSFMFVKPASVGWSKLCNNTIILPSLIRTKLPESCSCATRLLTLAPASIQNSKRFPSSDHSTRRTIFGVGQQKLGEEEQLQIHMKSTHQLHHMLPVLSMDRQRCVTSWISEMSWVTAASTIFCTQSCSWRRSFCSLRGLGWAKSSSS